MSTIKVDTISNLIESSILDVSDIATKSVDVASKVSSATLSASSGASIVGYLPAGTGAVATTVQNQLRSDDLDAVLNFGADNTGTTNCTAALLAFYNACIARVNGGDGGGGRIRAGIYKITPGVLIFDNGFVNKAWPHIKTDGHYSTIFQIDSATETDTAAITLKNGIASSGVGKYWNGGSHGGLTIKGSGTGAAYPNQHHYSLTGTWAIDFGYMASTNCKGNSFHLPVNLYGGTNPDPYANSFIHFDGIESNFAAGYGFYNGNYVGMDSWEVDHVRIIQPMLGGWFGIGSGNRLNDWSVANVTGWAFDDGTYVNATGGSPQRNYIEIMEMDNCQYGIRLNRSSRTKFIGVRFPTRYQTTPNVAAVYWPITAIDLGGGTSTAISNVDIDVQFRIEAGGLVGNLGTTINANNTGNVTSCNINFDYLDNAAFGLTDAKMMGIGWRLDTPNLVQRRTRTLWDSRDKAISYGRGSAATSIPNSGFGGASPIAFPVQLFVGYSTNYNTATSTFTAPAAGVYSWSVSVPLAVAIGTRVRIGVMVGAGLWNEVVQYSANAATVHYQASGHVVLTQGQTVYVTADQNTAGAVSCSPQVTNDEVRFVIAPL